MDIVGLLVSAGINIGLCVMFFSFYAILRKRPGNACLYFRQRLAPSQSRGRDRKLVPSWISEAWQASDEQILASGGLDAVVFLRIITFSIRIFFIAALFCIPLLPFNFLGGEMLYQHIPSMPLHMFTIGNISEGSKWLWLHCLALYIISCSAYALLFFENRNIAKMRSEHIVESSLNASYFTIVVRGIPSSAEESCSDSLRNFFKSYPASDYLSHQMVYQSGSVQKLTNDASKMISCTSTEQFGTDVKNRGLRVGTAHSFEVLSSEPENFGSRNDIADPDLRDKECAAAFVFFKSRYAALVASQVHQSEDPMSWVTDLAPEPHDVYWKNLSIPYHQLWVRRMAILFVSTGFMILFLVPVFFVQGLLHLEELRRRFPFLREVLKNKLMVRLITGYLPSVVLTLFLYAVPPAMQLFSTIEGPISRSSRKKSVCCKVLYFFIWNVFFVNITSADIVERFGIHMTTQFSEAVPRQATFFITYILTSGWASLASEILQPCALVCNIFNKYILRKRDEPSNASLSFPYDTEISRVLLLEVLGFTYCVMAPLILPFLLVFFFLASLVYRNQILNVYGVRYQSGGQLWPVMHNTTIFSLVLTQVIAIGVFGLKRSLAAAATVPLIICTLFFNEYCRKTFHPVFKNNPAQVFSDMDKRDERCGNMKVIHEQLPSAYCQFGSTSNGLGKSLSLNPRKDEDDVSIDIPESSNPGTGEMSEPTPNGVESEWACLEIQDLQRKMEKRLKLKETSFKQK